MAHTERSAYQFVVKQRNGKPWIYLQPLQKNLSILENSNRLENAPDFGFLGLELPEGTTFEEAEELASTLDDKITHVSFTKLIDVGY